MHRMPAVHMAMCITHAFATCMGSGSRRVAKHGACMVAWFVMYVTSCRCLPACGVPARQTAPSAAASASSATARYPPTPAPSTHPTTHLSIPSQSPNNPTQPPKPPSSLSPPAYAEACLQSPLSLISRRFKQIQVQKPQLARFRVRQ